METPLLHECARPRDPMPGRCNPTTRAEVLARLAVLALVEEARLTPKPGLVDQRGPGAHADMNLALMLRSAWSLEPMFTAMACAAADRRPTRELREELAQFGRAGESEMLAATGGVNTHRGAIWTLGLLVAAAAMGRGTSEELAQRAAEVARFVVRGRPGPTGHGVQIARRYGFSGARGEARDGFPHVLKHGLPALRDSRRRMRTETHARLDALMSIMAELDDTCLAYRGGLTALALAKAGARRVLRLGGPGAPAGYAAILRLHDALVCLGASPGGSADLLAAVLFLDETERQDPSIFPWKN